MTGNIFNIEGNSIKLQCNGSTVQNVDFLSLTVIKIR